MLFLLVFFTLFSTEITKLEASEEEVKAAMVSGTVPLEGRAGGGAGRVQVAAGRRTPRDMTGWGTGTKAMTGCSGRFCVGKLW